MSKDFEKEYRDLVSLEIPDLWDRIDAALPEKESKPEKNNTVEFNKETAKKRKKNPWPYIIPAISAAAIILFVAIPAIVLMSGGLNGSKAAVATDSLKEAENEAMMDTEYYEAAFEEDATNGSKSFAAADNASQLQGNENVAPAEIEFESETPNTEVVYIPDIEGYDTNERFEAYIEQIDVEDDEIIATVQYGVNIKLNADDEVLIPTQKYIIDSEGFVPKEAGVYGGLLRTVDDNTIEIYIYENYFK